MLLNKVSRERERRGYWLTFPLKISLVTLAHFFHLSIFLFTVSDHILVYIPFDHIKIFVFKYNLPPVAPITDTFSSFMLVTLLIVFLQGEKLFAQLHNLSIFAFIFCNFYGSILERHANIIKSLTVVSQGPSVIWGFLF